MKLPPDLWDHQRRALEAALAAIAAGQKAGLVVQPTGTGKTRLAVDLARLLAVPTLVLEPRDVLIDQMQAEFAERWPAATVGIIQAERDEWRDADLFAGRPPDVVIASVPSLHARRLRAIPPDRFGLLISDECHRSVAPGWSRAARHFQAGFHLGLTATPDRLDRKGLGVHFGAEPLLVYRLHEAIADGVLVTLRQLAARTSTDLDSVKEGSKGQWDEADLSRTVNTAERNHVVVSKYLAEMPSRRAVAFCVDCDHVRGLAAAFGEAGVPAVAITGREREARKQQLADFAAGKYRVAVNCEVLTEGFNDRGLSGILWCRPTQSKAFLMQGIGRGLRRCEGKTDCLVIDFVDVSRKHKLVTVCDLVGIRRTNDCQGKDVMAWARAETEEREREEAQAKQRLLTYPLAWRLEEVSPWPDLPSLHGYEVAKEWHREPATERQVKALARMGLWPGRALTRGEASWLFDRAREYEVVFPTPATPRQERYLRRAGAWQDGLSRREASRLIAAHKQAEEVGEWPAA